jgi:hypothetical protein
MLDRFELYELCVQSPRHVVAFLRGVHGQEPVILREDFCGTAAVSRRWCAEALKAGRDDRAIAIDLDTDALSKASEMATKGATVVPQIAFHRGDCTIDRCPAADEGADVVFVGNFSIGYIHRRDDLVRYFKRCRYRLKRGGLGTDAAALAAHGFVSLADEAGDSGSPTTTAPSGVFVCDTYGGSSAFKLGGFERQHPGKRGEIIRYYWSHDEADPRTAMVENSISFRVQVNGEIVQDSSRAFVYRWRLWSIAELREALLDAGYASIEVYKDVNVAPGQSPSAVQKPAELGEDWIVLMVARA